MNYWIMKSEPDTFSMSDLMRAKNQKTLWEGVRNYQARNYMRDQMKQGDKVFIYHSSCAQIGLAGLAEVSSKTVLVDPAQFDPQSDYFDPKATVQKPRWFCVEVKGLQIFKKIIELKELKLIPELSQLKLLATGNRLSIMPITKDEFEIMLNLN